jgi:hypothetical protein
MSRSTRETLTSDSLSSEVDMWETHRKCRVSCPGKS